MVLFHLLGVYLFVGIRLFEFHREARREMMLQSPNLVTLRFTTEKFNQNFIGKDEIQWQGQMYDILKVTKAENKFLLLAYPDKEEGNLFAFIDTLSNQESPTPNVPASWMHFFMLTFLAEASMDFRMVRICAELAPKHYLKSTYSVQHQVLVPPPRI